MKNKISAVILGHNTEDRIDRLYGLLNNFNEVIYIDDYSADGSERLCKKLGIKYYKRHLDADFASQRNFALENTECDWVIFVDTDEELDENLIDEIKNKVNNSKNNGYYINRKDLFLDHVMKGTEMGCDKMLKLGKRNKGTWERRVHEHWSIEKPVGVLRTPLIHHTALNLNHFIGKINYYSGIHSEENIRDGKKSSILKIFIYKSCKFIYNFLTLSGWKDGIYGFVVSILMSFHTFLSWSDMWLSKRK